MEYSLRIKILINISYIYHIKIILAILQVRIYYMQFIIAATFLQMSSRRGFLLTLRFMDYYITYCSVPTAVKMKEIASNTGGRNVGNVD